MKSSIFIPEKLKVGQVTRQGTFTGKLAYVTYVDQKGVLRKESSWEGWRDKKIEPLDFQNEPTDGFVLNKKAGGYGSGWNHRQSKIRVYDPRGFEFEITIENMLFILENTNSIKGKGLEGEFVYGWDGKDIILIPTASPDYVELSQFNSLVHAKKSFKGKDMIIGGTYLNNHNKEVIYMGRFDAYKSHWRADDGKLEGKKYFFASVSEDGKSARFENMASLGGRILDIVTEDCVYNYAELMEQLEKQVIYSPYDPSKDVYIPYDLEDFKKDYKTGGRGLNCFTRDRIPTYVEHDHRNEPAITAFTMIGYTRGSVLFKGALEEVFNIIHPMYLNKYLANGKLHQHKGRKD
jgi:hypothetical protein